MIADDIRQLLEARPFVPFTVHVADGRVFHVPTPDNAHVLPRNNRVDIYTDDNRTQFLPTLLISGVAMETVPQASDS